MLGEISAAEFLGQYWQQQPLLIRHALPDYIAPISVDELAGLALEPGVESRFVLESDTEAPWQLQHGPFSEAVLRGLPASGWSLLIQGLDLWVPELGALLDRFDFLPRWRFDDVMASLAPPGGSVGPH